MTIFTTPQVSFIPIILLCGASVPLGASHSARLSRAAAEQSALARLCEHRLASFDYLRRRTLCVLRCKFRKSFLLRTKKKDTKYRNWYSLPIYSDFVSFFEPYSLRCKYAAHSWCDALRSSAPSHRGAICTRSLVRAQTRFV